MHLKYCFARFLNIGRCAETSLEHLTINQVAEKDNSATIWGGTLKHNLDVGVTWIMKQHAYRCLLFLLLSIVMLGLISACGNASQNQVRMNETNFVQKSITIQKGESVTLVNDSAAIHVIENGSWVDGMQLPKIEAGAPQVHASVDGNISQIIGPFNTAGTFHLYCTVHPDMNLTVIVH